MSDAADLKEASSIAARSAAVHIKKESDTPSTIKGWRGLYRARTLFLPSWKIGSISFQIHARLCWLIW